MGAVPVWTLPCCSPLWLHRLLQYQAALSNYVLSELPKLLIFSDEASARKFFLA